MTTGFSPALLNFRRELDPPKPLYQNPVSQEAESVPPQDEEIADMNDHNTRLQKLKDVYELVRINLGRAFSTQSRHYNLRRRDWRCHVGDRVVKEEKLCLQPSKGLPQN